MSARTKRRLARTLGVVGSVGALTTLIAGLTLARLSSSQSSGANTFTTGTVTLTKNATTTCNVGPMSPGDSTAGWTTKNSTGNNATDTNAANTSNDNATLVTCSLTYTYAGTSAAYLALDISLAGSTAGEPTAQTAYGGSTATPANGLFDGTTNGLQLLVQDTSGAPTLFVNGTSYTPQGGGSTSLTANAGTSGGVTNLLMNTAPVTSVSNKLIKVDYFLPNTSSSDNYEGAATTITLTVHAVQAGNNSLPPGCTVVGQTCPAQGNFNWS
jgi:hypothetical protein